MKINRRDNEGRISFREYIKRIRVNNYLKLGFILGVLQFLIYLSGYDYLLTWGPFVAHHFIELPAFYIIGVGFSILFSDMGFTNIHAQGLNFLIFTLNLFSFSKGNINRILAAFIVSTPELIGFYYHRFLHLNK